MLHEEDNVVDELFGDVKNDKSSNGVARTESKIESASVQDNESSYDDADLIQLAEENSDEEKSSLDGETLSVRSSCSEESMPSSGRRIQSDDSLTESIANEAYVGPLGGSHFVVLEKVEVEEKSEKKGQFTARCEQPSTSGSGMENLEPWQQCLPDLNDCKLKDLVQHAMWLRSIARAYSHEMQKRLGFPEHSAAADHQLAGSSGKQGNSSSDLENDLTGNLAVKTNCEVVQLHRLAQSELKRSLEYLIEDVSSNVYKAALRFECTSCEKLFSSQSSLNAHIQVVHENVRKYACNYKNCVERFSSTTARRNHLRVHHPEM